MGAHRDLATLWQDIRAMGAVWPVPALPAAVTLGMHRPGDDGQRGGTEQQFRGIVGGARGRRAGGEKPDGKRQGGDTGNQAGWQGHGMAPLHEGDAPRLPLPLSDTQ